jgi:plastocyanin
MELGVMIGARFCPKYGVVLLFLALVSCSGKTSEPTGPPAYLVIDPATASVISGRVSYQGEKPSPQVIRMNAEASCVALYKEPVYSDQLVVNDDRSLQYVFVYVKGGLGSNSYAPPKEPVVLEQKGCMFVPHVLGLQIGQPLRIINSDPTTHNVHPFSLNNREWNKSMLPGTGPVEQKFTHEEIMIPVKCNVHPWMKGYIGVLRHPFFATTGKDGTYEIRGMPPGEYTIEAWHEILGSVTQEIVLGPKESKAINFTMKAASRE